MRHRVRGFAAWAFTTLFFAPGAFADPSETHMPTVIKTKPVFVADVLAQSGNDIVRGITDGDLVRVEAVARDSAQAFTYFDSSKVWREQVHLSRPEDFDNDGETRRWKLVGGMSFEDKLAEFGPQGEGGAPLGNKGIGIIDLKVWHRSGGDVTCTVVPVRVAMKKLYVEVDWLEGSFRKRVAKGAGTQTISYKPVIDQYFIDAFGQCGIEVVICDSPETGNTKNTIPADVMFDERRPFNCVDLAKLVDPELRDEKDAKAFNEGTSVISRWLLENDYVDLDPSRPDTVYMIGVQRWSKKTATMARTMGVVCLLEHKGKRIQMAYIFGRSIAESTAAVNRRQRTQVPLTVAARHTAIHEVAAHCFPAAWNNSKTRDDPDAYWSTWRYRYAGHSKRPEAQDDYFRIYETCVTSAETGLDGAYYAFMRAPRLNDFRWRMANSVEEKCRDLIRDYVADGQLYAYGHLAAVEDENPRLMGATRDLCR